MKKAVFIFLSFFLIVSFILIIDFTLSNTVLSYKNCFNYKEFYYELKKNCVGNYRFKKSFPIAKTITDERGLRVGKNSPQKNKDKKNIFIFGDSFTYGVGIDYDKTFVGLLENNNKNYNFYNFGVGSYSPSVYLYKFKKILNEGIYPEKIIIFLDLSDVLDEAERWIYDERYNTVKLKTDYIYQNSLKKEKFLKRNFKIMTNISSYFNFKIRNLREKTKIRFTNNRKIKRSIQGSFTYTKKEKLDQNYWKKNTFDKGINNLKNRLQQISRISKKNNVELFVTIYPWGETLEFGQEKFNWSNFIEEFCINNNCKTIDAIPVFQKYKKENINWSTDLYFLNDEHFNKKGANLLFETVQKYIF